MQSSHSIYFQHHHRPSYVGDWFILRLRLGGCVGEDVQVLLALHPILFAWSNYTAVPPLLGLTEVPALPSACRSAAGHGRMEALISVSHTNTITDHLTWAIGPAVAHGWVGVLARKSLVSHPICSPGQNRSWILPLFGLSEVLPT